MANALHYKSNLRDIFFNLFEVLEIQRTVLGQPGFENVDEVTMRDSLTQIERVCSNEIAASFVEGDRVPLKFDPDTGTVVVPDGIKKSIRAWFEGGWHMLEVPERLGGVGAPPSVAWATNEMFLGAIGEIQRITVPAAYPSNPTNTAASSTDLRWDTTALAGKLSSG